MTTTRNSNESGYRSYLVRLAPVIVASNDWGPPAKGSHESDLYRAGELTWRHTILAAVLDGTEYTEYFTARTWSQAT